MGCLVGTEMAAGSLTDLWACGSRTRAGHGQEDESELSANPSDLTRHRECEIYSTLSHLFHSWLSRLAQAAVFAVACPRPLHKRQGEADEPGSKAREVQGSRAPYCPQVAQGRQHQDP